MTNSLLTKLRNVRQKSTHHQHKLSAVILYKNKPLAFGFNLSDKTHPLMRKYHMHRTLHAEIVALLRVRNKDLLPDCTLMVYREDRHGNMVMSRPCPTCCQILKDYGLTRIMYTDNGEWVEETL